MSASQDTAAISAWTLDLAEAMSGRSSEITRFTRGSLTAVLSKDAHSVWMIVRRGKVGGLAVRAAYVGCAFECTEKPRAEHEAVRLVISSAQGEYILCVAAHCEMLDLLRVTLRFTPTVATLIPFLPRDLYPLGRNDDPRTATGRVEARQRRLNSGLVYAHVDEPRIGSLLYFQNLTAMNDYYRTTKTSPEDAVGGQWPELGYLSPVSPSSSLPAGKEVTLSDTMMVLRPETPSDERQSARHFLQMLGVVYQAIERPPTEYRDWIERSKRTLVDLDRAPEATVRHYRHRYLHPYTGAEYPDSTVQMSIVQAIHEWEKWQGVAHPLKAEFRAGMRKFYDRQLGTLRRYLPNVGDDKDAEAVDSWYLYHPLLNLARLALDGDGVARRLFFDSIEYGIKAARHFEYEWPIQFRVADFSVIEETAGADGRGQTDVGGVYAWVMLQAFELSDDKRYLDEARAAIDAAIGLGFAINYQANLTAWGAAACMRLWRITNREVYLEQSYVYLASFIHNCEIWESDLNLAEHYSNFMAVTCLQDAPYMAIYECFDSYAAFEHYLDDSGPDLEPAARMLVSEYCKYALSRAWFYYPDAHPREAIAEKQRENNGHIDRTLSFPLEDLYPDGQPAGQVGQEIYGAGAALIFATRAFHRIEGVPFLLYCDHFIRAIEKTAETSLTFMLAGGEKCVAAMSLVQEKRRKLPKVNVTTSQPGVCLPITNKPDRMDYAIPANGRVVISW